MQTKEISSRRDWRELARTTPVVLDGDRPYHRRLFRKILRGTFEEGRLSWQALTRWHSEYGARPQ